jgi:hypothetical protein
MKPNRQRTSANSTGPGQSAKGITRRRRDVFLRNPDKIVELAKTEGSVAIIDHDGRVRLLICIPTDERP